jgi:DNA-binding XRE family transcriptional regulator
MIEDIAPAHCRMARAALRITSADFAAKAGVPKGTLNLWESGRYRAPMAFRKAIMSLLIDEGVGWGYDEHKNVVVNVHPDLIEAAESPDVVRKRAKPKPPAL